MNWFEKAHELHSAGQLKEAEPLYQKALQERPDHEDALFWLAMLYTTLNRPLDAVDLFYRALALNPDDGGTHAGLGIALHALGQSEEAEESFHRALALEPDTPELYFHLSSAQFAQGHIEDALASCEKAIALKPDFVEAHHNRSEILRRLGRTAESDTEVRRTKTLQSLGGSGEAKRERGKKSAEKQRPKAAREIAANTHYQRGVQLQAAGHYTQAIAAFHQALALVPESVPVHNALGVIAIKQKAWGEAERHLENALALDPNYPEAYTNLGHVHLARKRFAEAEAAYRKAIAFRPGSAEFHANLSAAFSTMHRFAEAEASARAAILLNPRHAMAQNNLSSALFMQNRLEEALPHSLRAIEIQATPLFLCGLGNIQVNSGDFAGAEASFRRAIVLQPEEARAHTGLSGVYLLQGDLLRGWPEYAYVRHSEDAAPRAFSQPEWDGRPLPDGTVLLYTTQGFGDMIQFVRYLPQVKARVGTVILECYPELLSLFQDIPGADIVVAKAANGTLSELQFDVQTSVMDLPRLFQTELATIPANVPYLIVDAEKRQQWAERTGKIRVSGVGCRVSETTNDQRLTTNEEGESPTPEHLNTEFPTPDTRHPTPLKVGISWAGRPEHLNDHNRSCRLEDFSPLADIPGVTLFSLQKGQPIQQVGESKPILTTDAIKNQKSKIKNPDTFPFSLFPFPLTDLAPDLNDFTDTAAAIANLDLVISVDTALVHLAGALGKPVWTLLPYSPDWRWMLERTDTPWYPTMRLFRQLQRGDWASLFAQVAEALSSLVSSAPKI